MTTTESAKAMDAEETNIVTLATRLAYARANAQAMKEEMQGLNAATMRVVAEKAKLRADLLSMGVDYANMKTELERLKLERVELLFEMQFAAAYLRATGVHEREDGDPDRQMLLSLEAAVTRAQKDGGS